MADTSFRRRAHTPGCAAATHPQPAEDAVLAFHAWLGKGEPGVAVTELFMPVILEDVPAAWQSGVLGLE